MTSFDARPAGERHGRHVGTTMARPAPAARPTITGYDAAASRTATVPAATVPAATVPAASRAAAREAALAALSAARSGGDPVAMPFAATVHSGQTRPGDVVAPAQPSRRRTGGRLGGVGVFQIICWQLALTAVVLVVGQPWPATASAVLVAGVVVALTAVRVRGHWLYEWVGWWSSYQLRDRDRDLPGGDETGRALLRLISPDAVGINGAGIDGAGINRDDRDGTEFMVSRAEGITAVLRPQSTGRDPGASVPAPQVLLPAPDEQALAFAVQVVHHAGPNRAHPPRVWIALQALRTAEVYQDADVRQALRNAIRRVRRRLRRDGLPLRTLSEHETLGTFAALSHVNAGRGRIRERWRLWQSGPIGQAAFRLDGWAALSPSIAQHVLRWLLAAAPQAAVTIAVTARNSPTGAEPLVNATLRIAAASPPELDRAEDELTRLARGRGIGMARLDGRHARGIAATLPFGVIKD